MGDILTVPLQFFKNTYINDNINLLSSDYFNLQLTGWLPVQREVKIEWDFESTPLEIKTDSVLGSGDRVHVKFHPADGHNAGDLQIYFTSHPQYNLGWCSTSNTNFPVTPPSLTDKVWRISRTAGVRVVIHCNEVEVLNKLLSSCTHSERRSIWNQDVASIEFYYSERASDYYRPQPGD